MFIPSWQTIPWSTVCLLELSLLFGTFWSTGRVALCVVDGWFCFPCWPWKNLDGGCRVIPDRGLIRNQDYWPLFIPILNLFVGPEVLNHFLYWIHWEYLNKKIWSKWITVVFLRSTYLDILFPFWGKFIFLFIVHAALSICIRKAPYLVKSSSWKVYRQLLSTHKGGRMMSLKTIYTCGFT